MKILVAVTGGISAYKALSVISALRKNNHQVKVITTDNALKFVTADSLIAISKDEYYVPSPGKSTHVDLAKWCDAMVVVPTTANTLSNFAHGFADNLVTGTFLALHRDKYKIIALSMNTNMYNNIMTVENKQKLLNSLYNVHFIDPIDGLLACGDIGIGKLQSTQKIVSEINQIISSSLWQFPLPTMKKLGPTNDSFSYLDYAWACNVEIPIHPHCGSFGIRRKFDVHKGVDLYAPVGTPVHAVEDGIIYDIVPFTGKRAGCDWWEETMGIYVKGKSGMVVYGEITPEKNLKPSMHINAGTKIAEVARVIKHPNKRPASMLHLELHDTNMFHTETWEIGNKQPDGLLNPTTHLLNSK